MTVGQLKALLEGVDESMQVYIPASEVFDGKFVPANFEDSGVTTMGMGDYDEEDLKEMELLNKPIEDEEDYFLLVPKGFWDEESNEHYLN